MKLKRLLLSLLVVISIGTCLPATAQPMEPLILSGQQHQLFAGKYMRWISGPAASSPAIALNHLLQSGHPVTSNYPSFGFVPDGRWMLLKLNNQSSRNRWILKAGRPYITKLDAYVFNAQGQLLKHWRAGAAISFSTRQIKHPALIFSLSLPKGESYLLLHAVSDEEMNMPVILYTPKAFHHDSILYNMWYGAAFGSIFIICLYNLLVFLSIRERSYLLCTLYLFSFGFSLLAIEGFSFQWLWPNAPVFNRYTTALFNLITLAMSGFFVRDFLKLKHYLPKTATLIFWLSWLALLAIPFVFTWLQPMLIVVSALILIWPSIAIILGIIIARKSYVPARYMVLAFAIICISVTLYAMKSFTLVGNSWLLENSLPAGVIVQGLLLSFALAHRLRITQQESELALQHAQHELEEKVAERTGELQKALNARSNFLAVMSHEVRTPLNGIIGTLDLFKTTSLNTEQQQKVSILERSSNNLFALINDILDFTRIEAGKMPIHKAPINLSTLARECCSLFEQKASLNGSILQLHIGENAGACVLGDGLRIRQILLNLISNAVKFCHDGHIDVDIRRDKDNDDNLRFSVTDTGMGIPKSQQQVLFGAFEQLDNSSSRQNSGTGLGLAICQKLVDIMNGDIGVESQEGVGSIFWFDIPLPTTSCQLESPTTKPAPAQKRSLLIVDDNHVNLMVAESLCKQLGHDVETCDSGAEAIALLQYGKVTFDAVLLDCEMPIMDGFTTSRKIIRLQREGKIPACPIAALTAHAIPEKIRESRDAGMVLHITKPIHLEKLDACLRELLNS